jgi:hypothetical protein
MSYTVSLADLRNMTPAERDSALSELVTSAKAPRNGQRAVLAAKIRAFETRYEMTSEQMVKCLREGTQKETAEISRWLFWLRAST